MLEHTPENCEKLAREIAESMELEDLVQYVVDNLYDLYIDDKESFLINQG